MAPMLKGRDQLLPQMPDAQIDRGRWTPLSFNDGGSELLPSTISGRTDRRNCRLFAESMRSRDCAPEAEVSEIEYLRFGGRNPN
jgi:hypothetical protein